MATRYFCDRCNREVSAPIDLYKIEIDDTGDYQTRKRIFEVCDECDNAIFDFVDKYSTTKAMDAWLNSDC